MKKLFLILLMVVLVSVLIFGGCAGQAKQQIAAEFYKGKTITLLVSGGPGGTSDMYARVVASYFADATGAKVSVKNETEGGGLVVLNKVYKGIEPDGLNLLFAPTGNLFPNWAFDETGVEYDITKYEYIASALGGRPAFLAKAGGPYTTIPEMQKATKTLLVSGRSAGNILVTATLAAAEILGLKLQVITGFTATADRDMAVVKGEVDLTTTSIVAAKSAEGGGLLKTVMIISDVRNKSFSDVPALTDYKQLTDADKLLLKPLPDNGMAMAAPPGTPKDRVNFLREALTKVYENKDYQASMKNVAGIWIGYVSGEAVLEEAQGIAAGKAQFKAIYQELRSKYIKK